MSSRENRQALRDAVALVSAATRDPAMFTALTRFYGFNEEQARLVRMLAAVASQAEALEDVDGFALYLAGAGMSGQVSERLVVEGRSGRRRLLRILSRHREAGFEVLTLAPQRRRCHQVGCLRLAEVPAVFWDEHERRAAR